MQLVGFCLLWPCLLFGSVISIVGDSITAGACVKEGEGYVEVLKKRYLEEEKDIKILCCPYTGALTSHGPGSTKELINLEKPDYFVIFLGINDAGLGVPEEIIKQNFSAMISMAQPLCKYVILGLVSASTVNPRYNFTLCSVYSYLLENYEVYPIMLLSDEVLATAQDRIHPNAEGHQMIAEKLYEVFHILGEY